MRLHPELFIDSIAWDRISVTLTGHSRYPIVGEHHLFVERADTGARVALPGFSSEGTNFTIRFNVMQVDGGFPLRTSEWGLFVAGGVDDDRAPVFVSGDFSYDPMACGGFFTTRSMHYWVMPVCAPENRFVLGVSYARPKRPVRRDVPTRWRAWVRKTRSRAFAATYTVFRKLVPKNGRRILFTSESRAEMSGNLADVYDRMVERGLDKQYKMRSAFKQSSRARRGISEKWAFAYHLAVSDVILMDDFQPIMYKVEFDPSVKIIQLWHASGAFKTVGYSRIGKPGGPSPFGKGHRVYTAAVVSSEHDRPYYAEAFGIPEDLVKPVGIPRMDMFFNEEHKARAREEVYASFPELRDREVILFAPTFRGAGPASAYYDMDRVDLGALHALCEERDAMLVVKMHPFVRDPLDIPAELTDRIVDASEWREVNSLLLVSDLVITDYSSIVFEYSVLEGPMLFYAYDLEEYVADRDFYEPFESFVPGKIVRTFDDLMLAIKENDFEHEKVAEFAHRHFSHLDGGSTDRVIDTLVLG